MLIKVQRMSAAVSLLLLAAACGGGGGGGGGSAAAPSGTSSSAASVSSTGSSSSTSSTASSSGSAVDAASLTGTSTPLQIAQYGIRNFSAPVLVNGLHSPANYQVAPALPTFKFATVDPTGGVLSIERETAPANGWHAFSRKGPVTVTGGSAAASNRIYTVFNGQQLVAALNEAGNDPKIIRVVGHIDLRWSSNNTVFTEYTSYSDQKYGGSIAIPSNTTLIGVNNSDGTPARITGTSILVGGELALTAGGDPETDFKAWIAAGKDGDDYPTWTRNVIIRNLSMDTPWDVNPEDSGNAYADGITVSRAQNIWIDHVSISDGNTPDSLATDTRHDGALDVVRGSDYVTLSNTYIEKHHKTTLVGNGDSGRAWSDAGRLHVTMTGMWWSGTASRLPLVRFGQLHLYNNFIEGSTTTSNADLKYESGLDVRYQSNVISESNYYSFTGLKPKEICGKLVMGGTAKQALGYRTWGTHRFISDKTDDGKLWATVFSGPIDADLSCASETLAAPATADAWLPPYAYTAVSADVAYTSIKANTGAGHIGAFAVAGTGVGAFGSSSSAASSTTSSSSSAASSAASSTSSASSSSTSSSASSTTGAVVPLALVYSAQSFGGSTGAADGSAVIGSSSVVLTSIKGKLESTKDSMSMATQLITGDFTIVATVTLVSPDLTVSSSNQYRAGLMLCDCAAGTSASAPMYAQAAIGIPSAGYVPVYAGRLAAAGTVGKANFSGSPVVTPGSLLMLKLVRSGQTYTASYSTDGGASYVSNSAQTFTGGLPTAVQVGVFAASGVSSPGATVTFSNITITQ